MAARSSRMFVISGKPTRIQLEHEFWDALEEISERETLSVADLLTVASRRHPQSAVTSSVRAFVTAYFREMAEAAPVETSWRLQ